MTIEASQAPVKSVELQLVRVETVKHPDSGNTAREATEIQNIQIGDGDVCRNLVRRGAGWGLVDTQDLDARTANLRAHLPPVTRLPCRAFGPCR